LEKASEAILRDMRNTSSFKKAVSFNICPEQAHKAVSRSLRKATSYKNDENQKKQV
jgi:hypothetical protein